VYILVLAIHRDCLHILLLLLQCPYRQRHEHQWGTPASLANAQSKLFTKQREVELKMSKVQQQAEAGG